MLQHAVLSRFRRHKDGEHKLQEYFFSDIFKAAFQRVCERFLRGFQNVPTFPCVSKGFQRVQSVSKGFQKGFKAFQKGFQRVSKRFKRVSKGFQSVSKGFPKGFQRVSEVFLKGFKSVSKGFQTLRNRVSKGFQSDLKPPKKRFCG